MKKTQYTLLFALSAFFVLLNGCKSPEPAVPFADKIKRSYTASQVTEGSTVVYNSTGGTSTKPGYTNFLLDLSNPPVARYRALDGTLATGTYTTVGENQVVLSGLTPVLTSTNGTITFTVTDVGDGTTPTFTRVTPDQKTGNTINIYRLKTP